MLAELALGKMRPKRAALKEALNGRFDDHHAELISLLLDEVDSRSAKIDRLTKRVSELLGDIPAAAAPPPGAGGAGEDAAPLDAVGRLDEITGIGVTAAQTIIAEVGLDMGQLPTAGHLVSWAKLSPRTVQSGTTLSTNKVHRVVPATHGSLLLDETDSAHAVRAIAEVVRSVRTRAALPAS